MGMYTEIYISAEIKESTPTQVLDILKYLFSSSREEKPSELPDHAFFKSSRWYLIGISSSYYFIPFSTSRMTHDGGSYYITSRSDLKNYSDEIEKFFSWVMPYVEAEKGAFIGYERYEENLLPKLYIKD